jgi:hypothetical protein
MNAQPSNYLGFSYLIWDEGWSAFERPSTGTGPVLRCKPGTGFIDLEQRSQHAEVLEIPQIRKLAFLLVVFGALNMAHQDVNAEMSTSELAARAFGIIRREGLTKLPQARTHFIFSESLKMIEDVADKYSDALIHSRDRTCSASIIHIAITLLVCGTTYQS